MTQEWGNAMILQRKAHDPRWEAAKLRELEGDCPNPGRGWYRIYTFRPEQKNRDELDWLPMEDSETVALVRLDIGAFRQSEIDEQTLVFVEEILDRFRLAGKEMILRVVYDTVGKGMEHEPSSLTTVLSHMRQLGAIAARHADDILVTQGLFVGNWGEMHGSKFLSPEQVRKLAQTWREATGGAIPMAFRKPSFCRMVLKEGQGGIGIYDDALFASADHLGTFSEKAAADAGWEEEWRMEDELAYLERTAPFVPCGGEAVAPDQEADIKTVLALLQNMRISYLNCIYDGRILDQWRNLPYPGEGTAEKSLYQFIGEHLGYRMVIRQTVMERKTGRLKILVENTGFSNFCRKARLSLVIQDKEGNERTLPVEYDIRTLKGGEQAWILADLQDCGAGNVFLAFEETGKRPVRFANEGAKDRLYLGMLGEKKERLLRSGMGRS